MFINQRLLLHDLGLAVSLVFPSGHIHEVLVVAEGLSIGSLMLGAEMAATGFLTMLGVVND